MKFNLIVEGPVGGPNGDFLEVSPHLLALKNLEWQGKEPPDIVTLERATLVLVGRYASGLGNIYRYRVATVCRLIGGRLSAPLPQKGL